MHFAERICAEESQKASFYSERGVLFLLKKWNNKETGNGQFPAASLKQLQRKGDVQSSSPQGSKGLSVQQLLRLSSGFISVFLTEH